MPLVSIIVPIFNAGAFVGQAIESLLAQTCRDFELLAVDDGSTDESIDVVARFKDPRIRIIRSTTHVGLAAALNLGMAQAKGELIARQDADDFSAPERIERQVAALRADPGLALLGTQGWVADAGGVRRGAVERSRHAETIRWYSLVDNPFIHTSVMFRRSVIWDELGGYDERCQVSQDYELWSRVVRGHDTRNLPDRLVTYRVRASSITGQREDGGAGTPAQAAFEAIVRRIVTANLQALCGGGASDDHVRLMSCFLLGLPAADVAAFLDLFGRLLVTFERRFPLVRKRNDFHWTLARQYDALAYRVTPPSRAAAVRIYVDAVAREPAVARYLPWRKAVPLIVLGRAARARAGRLLTGGRGKRSAHESTGKD